MSWCKIFIINEFDEIWTCIDYCGLDCSRMSRELGCQLVHRVQLISTCVIIGLRCVTAMALNCVYKCNCGHNIAVTVPFTIITQK